MLFWNEATEARFTPEAPKEKSKSEYYAAQTGVDETLRARREIDRFDRTGIFPDRTGWDRSALTDPRESLGEKMRSVLKRATTIGVSALTLVGCSTVEMPEELAAEPACEEVDIPDQSIKSGSGYDQLIYAGLGELGLTTKAMASGDFSASRDENRTAFGIARADREYDSAYVCVSDVR